MVVIAIYLFRIMQFLVLIMYDILFDFFLPLYTQFHSIFSLYNFGVILYLFNNIFQSSVLVILKAVYLAQSKIVLYCICLFNKLSRMYTCIYD